MPLLAIALTLSILGMSPAHADDAPEQTLCLSDGQPLEAAIIDVHGAHRTVRIADRRVRIPTAVLGETCRTPHRSSWAKGVRRVVLEDGQELLGTPIMRADGLSLLLLDGRSVLLPPALVDRTVRPRPAEAETTEATETTEAAEATEAPASRAAPARGPYATEPPRASPALTQAMVGPVGAGMVAIALLGGVLFGLRRVEGAQAR